ncbi:uncharacterized protein LOC143574963 [Bidens hawaiensis]|uniref:uncharacterized protein LOC143574963 n=1 Tax=Bidens hawaiensis TaxID=980011 RepID=UPI00404B863E
MSMLSCSKPNNHSHINFFFIPLTTLFLLLFSVVAAADVTVTISSDGGPNHEASVLYTWLHGWGNSVAGNPYFSTWRATDDTNINPCKWDYIKCNAAGFVTEINIQSIPLQLPMPTNLSSFPHLNTLVISGANITGTLSDDLGGCQELITIDLSSNSLVGPIPNSIGLLQNLQNLILNSNKLTGKIPYQLGNCKSLKSLLLHDNRLSGSIPTDIGRLGSLEVIRAGGNNDLSGNIPYEIGNCGNLTVLGLADTRISGSLPSSIGKLTKLQTLSIYTAMLSGELPPELGNCTELVEVFIYENSITGPIIPQIGNLKKLEKLLLWQNNFIGSIPEEIGNCTKLKMFDVSLNSLSGMLPASTGNLVELVEFMISNNNVSGSIPVGLANAINLQQLQLDTNQISGLIPSEIGRLTNLEVFFAWDNNLEGSIPASLGSCSNLQALDLSHNSLTGSIPSGLFQLQNLTKLLLISNDISGSIPREIGNSTSLVRLRLGNNRITGEIPREISGLKSINFLDLSGNRISGAVPDEIASCSELQMIDLSNNMLNGPLPESLSSLSGLQVLDVSRNHLDGPIPSSLGRLVSLNKLVMSQNEFSGAIPGSLQLCSGLQFLDLSSNKLSGEIPSELGNIQALEIALNLSCNGLTGPIPGQIGQLSKLSTLDMSYNKLEGNLSPLSHLDNLVSLNISYNNFTGYLPDNKLFRQLTEADLAGNQGLCSFGKDSCFLSSVAESGNGKDEYKSRNAKRLKLALALLITLTIAMMVMGVAAVLRARRGARGDDVSELGESWPWQFTPFQKLNISVDRILKCLVDTNVIGKGCSGVVYRADMDNGEIIAVKKLWPSMTVDGGYEDEKSAVRDSFSAEVKTLGSVRHKNIVRFLGCCWNKKTRLLMYDYMPNGSLGSLLHERMGSSLEWDLRYRILLGAAEGLAYLHHDCVPPIVHRDIKANNILIGLEFEAYIADFGLAKLVNDGDFARSSKTIAGSYGYIAPEYGYSMKITEKSDVYSYGVVMLEVLTGKQPIDPTIPDGLHVVDWVKQRKEWTKVLDPSLLSRPESDIEELMQTLGIALLCVYSLPEERPTMKDVAAMLKEIKHEREEYAKVDALLKGSPEPRATASSSAAAGSGVVTSNPNSFSGSSLYSSCSKGPYK